MTTHPTVTTASPNSGPNPVHHTPTPGELEIDESLPLPTAIFGLTLEFAPDPELAKGFDPGQHPRNMSKPETIDAWRREQVQSFMLNAVEYPFYAKPVRTHLWSLLDFSGNKRLESTKPFDVAHDVGLLLEKGAVIFGFNIKTALQALGAYGIQHKWGLPMGFWRPFDFGGGVYDPIDFFLGSGSRTGHARQKYLELVVSNNSEMLNEAAGAPQERRLLLERALMETYPDLRGLDDWAKNRRDLWNRAHDYPNYPSSGAGSH